MGLLQHIKNWFGKPLTPSTSPMNLALIVLIVIVAMGLWQTLLLQIMRIGRAVAE